MSVLIVESADSEIHRMAIGRCIDRGASDLYLFAESTPW
jgi:hypothetical protein